MNRRRPTPFDLGPVHFVGIGGIGMSGIAEIMLRVGYTVQGSAARASGRSRMSAASALMPAFLAQQPIPSAPTPSYQSSSNEILCHRAESCCCRCRMQAPDA
jgi:hypothetical protein